MKRKQEKCEEGEESGVEEKDSKGKDFGSMGVGVGLWVMTLSFEDGGWQLGSARCIRLVFLVQTT